MDAYSAPLSDANIIVELKDVKFDERAYKIDISNVE